jgi:hypothetical protein
MTNYILVNMSYSQTEILVGVLVLSCLLLLYCNKSKQPDGMKNRYIPGLHMGRDGYSNMPKAGSFEGYVVGHPGDESLSYTVRSGMSSEPCKGLNELQSVQTPAGNNVTPPTGNENAMLWRSNADVRHDIYNCDGLNDHAFGDEEARQMYNNVFAREVNRTKNKACGSLSGDILSLTDYGESMPYSREITM